MDDLFVNVSDLSTDDDERGFVGFDKSLGNFVCFFGLQRSAQLLEEQRRNGR